MTAWAVSQSDVSHQISQSLGEIMHMQAAAARFAIPSPNYQFKWWISYFRLSNLFLSTPCREPILQEYHAAELAFG